MKLTQFLKEGRAWGIVTIPALKPESKQSNSTKPLKEFSNDTEVDMLDREVSNLKKTVKALEGKVSTLETQVHQLGRAIERLQ